jgi:anti-sigma B factor antagonist
METIRDRVQYNTARLQSVNPVVVSFSLNKESDVKISVQPQGPDTSLVCIEGDFDFHSSPELRKELTKLSENQTKKILIDLTQVNYIDSSGLATFVELFQRMKRYSGKLILFNLAQSVRSVFEIAKLDTIFQLVNSREEALAAAQ